MGGVMKTCVVKFIRKGDAGDPAVTYRIQLLSATAHVDTDKVMRGAITWNVIKEVSGVETYINSSTGTHQCKLSSASSWSTAGSSGNNFNDNGLINGVSFSTAGSPTHLLIRFVLGGNVKCTLAVGISVDGVKGDFKSIVFKRTNTTPVSTPSGGTYDSPVPSGWSDSIPSGQAKLWASECTFYGAGGSSGWSTPRQMTDTDTYDVEFSDVDQNPGTPSTNPSNWFDPDTDTSKDFTQMLWRAERECINGTWGSWTVVRIKGEKGDTGARSFKSTCFIRTNNSSLAVPTGGSFSSPIPTSTVYDSASGTYLSWSDGIPSGQAKLWAVTRIFTSDGQSPQQSAWSTPRQMTDTDTYDVEFSDVDQNPGTPSTNPSNWFDPDTDTSKDFTQMLWRAERECINGTWGSWTVVRIKGEKGDKGDGVNPNILLRTIFDRGIDTVKEAWTSNWSYVGIDGASDTVVQGRKSIRINATNAGSDVDFQQNVYGRIKVSTWYTLSFNVFATAAWHFFIYNGTNSTSVIDLSAGYIIDGEAVSTSAIDGRIVFASEWAGTRHSITFKTRSSFSNTNANILFRCLSGKQLAICMPKLEEGKVATAYVAHEDDQKGDQGNPSTVPGPRGYRGPALRGPQDWSQMDVGFQFYKGDADTQEPYEDFVVYNGTYYKCKKTHTKTTTNYPGSTADTNNGYWELTTKVGIVAANILFGDHGYFGSAIISGDWMISTNGTIDGVAYNNRATYNGVLAYSLFNPNNPLGKPITLYDWTGTKTIASGTTTSSFTTVSLVAGKTYFVRAAGKTSNANGVVYVRLRNTSTGATYSPIMINGSSDVLRSGYINCTVTGSYYLEMYHTDSYTGTVNSCFMSEKNFAPNYCLDLLTGKTYQGDIYVRGGVRSPFTFLGVNGTFNNDFSDNVAVYSGSASSYSLPWTTDQSGRKVVVTNYYWNGNYSTATGYAELTAPTGKYFYEDGVQKSTLKLSREAVELLGYGDTSSFYGWIVLKRIDLGTNKRYGHQMKMLAVGRVTSKMNSATISYHSFDGTTLTVTKVANEVGKYVISWNNANWFANANSPFIIATGYGKTLANDSEFNDTAVFANVAEQTTTSVTIWTADDASRNNGSFNFFIMNFDDWIYL